MRRWLGFLLFASALASLAGAAESPLPNRPVSVKFAVIGDGGTGDRAQYEVAARMVRARQAFPFDLVLMVGDNFLGSQRPADLVQKFDRPYKPLIDAGVIFRAALGNHDEPSTAGYPPLNMNGQRYYTFARNNIRFVALDTNALDRRQLQWADETLGHASEAWKICYFHHPLYSNGGHGPAVDIRVLLEPLLIRHGVDVVFSGHDHVYERLMPQNGIQYFVAGAAGRLRKGDLDPRSRTTAAGFDRDQSFLLAEIDGDELYFDAISRTGASVDSGIVHLERSNVPAPEGRQP